MSKKYKKLTISKKLFTSLFKIEEENLGDIWTSYSDLTGEKLLYRVKNQEGIVEFSEDRIKFIFFQEFINMFKDSCYNKDMMISTKQEVTGYAVMFRYIGQDSVSSFYGETENEALLNAFETFWGDKQKTDLEEKKVN